ncbi:MAG: HldE protein [Chlamydiae bacterium]|nr:HldE protein [Chlamydiota bacterium]
MVKLLNSFNRLRKIKALVIGDFMLDKYTTGKVRRISPEAPVTVLEVENEEVKPGGAGNVVLNLLSLEASVLAIGRIGSDKEGRILSSLLKKEGVDTNNLFIQKNYKTPLKNRMMASGQQMLRVDSETVLPLSLEIEEALIKRLDSLLKDVQVVAVSDYAKGFLSHNLLQKIIQTSLKKNIVVVVDPKGIDFKKYSGASVLKPNLSEAYQAAKLSFKEPIEKAAKIILQETKIDHLVITKSEAGISVFDKKGKQSDFPVRAKEVKDGTGAGDTVLAVICFCLANNIDIGHAIELSNIAGALAIEQVGCARISLNDLASRLLEFNLEKKIFDPSQLYALKKVFNKRPFTLLAIKGEQEISSHIFKTIRERAQKRDLIVYLDKIVNEDFVHLLTSLHEVKFVIAKKDNLKEFCKEALPKEVFLINDNKTLKLNSFKLL